MVGSDSWEKVARFFFLERGNTTLIGKKTDVRKHAISTHFPIMKRSRPILHLLSQIPIGIPRPNWPVERSSCSSSPAKRPVERSKFFPAVWPCISSPHQHLEAKLIDAKLQPPIVVGGLVHNLSATTSRPPHPNNSPDHVQPKDRTWPTDNLGQPLTKRKIW